MNQPESRACEGPGKGSGWDPSLPHNQILTRLDFPAGPGVKTPRFHCRGRGSDPWSKKFCMLQGTAKKKILMGSP